MLGKLMKYEFRATAIYFLPIYAMLILVSGLRYAVSLITEKFSGSYPVFSTFGLSAAYFLLAFGLAVTTFVVIIIRFYKNLLGAEGYLMFTLPVSISQNILAKLIPAVVWFFGSLTLGMLTIAPAMGMRFRDNPLVLMFTGVHLSDLPEIILGLLFVIGSIATVFLFYYLCMCIGQIFSIPTVSLPPWAFTSVCKCFCKPCPLCLCGFSQRRLRTMCPSQYGLKISRSALMNFRRTPLFTVSSSQ